MIEAPEATDALRVDIQAVLAGTAGAVAEWELHLGEDWSGDPGVFITVTFKDSELQRVWPARRSLQASIEEHARKRFPGRFPYIVFMAQTIAANPLAPAGRRQRR